MKKLLSVARETQRLYAENEMAVYAGYTTLYILMAMVPLLTLVIGLVNLVPTVDLEHFKNVVQELLPNIPQLQTMFQAVIANVNRRAGQLAVSISVLASLWSASNGVNAIQMGLRKLNGAPAASFLKKRGSALLYTLLFILLIPALLIFRVLRGSLRTLIASLGQTLGLPEQAGWLLRVLQLSGILTAALMALMVLLAYTFLQGERRSFRDQLPGAVFATLLWLAFSALFEVFISRFWKASSLYGSLASIFLAAMWLKTITTILFYGEALNVALRSTRAVHPPTESEA